MILEDEEVRHPEVRALTQYWLRSLARSPGEKQVIEDYLAARKPR